MAIGITEFELVMRIANQQTFIERLILGLYIYNTVILLGWLIQKYRK